MCLLGILGNFLKLFAPQTLNMSFEILNSSPFQMPSPLRLLNLEVVPFIFLGRLSPPPFHQPISTFFCKPPP